MGGPVEKKCCISPCWGTTGRRRTATDIRRLWSISSAGMGLLVERRRGSNSRRGDWREARGSQEGAERIFGRGNKRETYGGGQVGPVEGRQ